MLIKATTLSGYKLESLDGEIASVVEFYFDDRYWTIRYLAADTGDWFAGKQVLISPHALASVNTEKETITVNLTKKQIQKSPSWDSDKPVSRQFEQDYYSYYGWPMYWSGRSMWGDTPHIERDPGRLKQHAKANKAWDPHLLSTSDVIDHHIQATDGEIGHVADYLLDDETWAIRYLVIDTQNWWPGNMVLVAPQWIDKVSWSESKVYVSLSRKTVELSPEYTSESMLTRDYEESLHLHYNRKGYWQGLPAVESSPAQMQNRRSEP